MCAHCVTEFRVCSHSKVLLSEHEVEKFVKLLSLNMKFAYSVV